MLVPEFWIVAGPNGAGKTTCVQKEPLSLYIPEVAFFNPDNRTLEKLHSLGYQGFRDAPIDVQTKSFFESADEVFAELEKRISANEAVGVETVLSSPKYCSLVEKVLEREGFVGLIYVALSSPAIAQQRVAARVKRGGHGIPDDKIEQRWRRSLEYLPWFAGRARAFWVVDSSDSDPESRPRLLASGKLGLLEHLDENAFPELKQVLSTLPRDKRT
jgi:predicted ABC-type ATPase